MADPKIVQRIAFKAVVINRKNEVLLLREAVTYKDGTKIGCFGVPGGRLEPGEAWQDGLSREVREETGLNIDILRPIYVGEWRPVIKGVQNQIVAVFMLCRAKGTSVTYSDEHDGHAWVTVESWQKFEVMEPDDKVLETYFYNTELL